MLMNLDGAIKAILHFLRQPLKYCVGLGTVAALALFLPDSIVNRMGLLQYRDKGKPCLGVVLLLCVAVAISAAVDAGARKFNRYRFLVAGKKRLHRLTREEKQILGHYIEGQTRSVDLAINDGVVNGLVSESIIYRSASVSSPGGGFVAFAHNIQPWAWDYLNKHRDLLDL